MVTKAEIEAARLKPIMCVCPFCGSYDIDPEGGLGQDAEGKQYSFPVCEKCGATAPSVKVWNKRTITTDAIQIATKVIKAQGFIINHKTAGAAVDMAMHSTAEIAGNGEIKDLFGDDPQHETVIETELGAWVRRDDRFWQHIRTAEY
jgi:hypothetical protein